MLHAPAPPHLVPAEGCQVLMRLEADAQVFLSSETPLFSSKTKTHVSTQVSCSSVSSWLRTGLVAMIMTLQKNLWGEASQWLGALFLTQGALLPPNSMSPWGSTRHPCALIGTHQDTQSPSSKHPPCLVSSVCCGVGRSIGTHRDISPSAVFAVRFFSFARVTFAFLLQNCHHLGSMRCFPSLAQYRLWLGNSWGATHSGPVAPHPLWPCPGNTQPVPGAVAALTGQFSSGIPRLDQMERLPKVMATIQEPAPSIVSTSHLGAPQQTGLPHLTVSAAWDLESLQDDTKKTFECSYEPFYSHFLE